MNICDICQKEGEELFEFELEYSPSKRTKIIELYYSCSFKCYISLLEKLLEESKFKFNLKLAGMDRDFAQKMMIGVRGAEHSNRGYERTYLIDEHDIFLLSFDKAREALNAFYVMFPHMTGKSEETIMRRFNLLKEKQKLQII